VTRRFAIISVALFFGLAACGKDNPVVTGGAPEQQQEQPAQPQGQEALPVPPIEDAEALAAHLTAIAETNVQTDPGDSGEFGIVDAWVQTYPTLEFAGYANDPDEDTVTLLVNVANSKNVAGPENPYLVSAAALDTSGTCAGAVAAGFPSPTTFEAVTLSGHCDPFSAAIEAGYQVN
jgi:hypothetical protein